MTTDFDKENIPYYTKFKSCQDKTFRENITKIWLKNFNKKKLDLSIIYEYYPNINEVYIINNLSHNNTVKYIYNIPHKVKYLKIFNKKLKKIKINYNLEYLSCHNNNIQRLNIIASSLYFLSCEYNKFIFKTKYNKIIFTGIFLNYTKLCVKISNWTSQFNISNQDYNNFLKNFKSPLIINKNQLIFF